MVIAYARGQSERSLIREGNRLYNNNKYPDAEVNYRKALEKNKDMREGAFNLGDALYRQGRYGEAAEQYEIAASRAGKPVEKAEAIHNLGNSLLKGRKIPESIAAYKEALKLSPNDADTKYNLEYAKMMLKEQQQNKKNKEQQKQEEKSQDQQKEGQQKQDVQKQQQAEQKDLQQKQAQQKKQQISKQDAERILEALRNEEKDVQKKLHKRIQARVRVEKDW